MDRERIWLIRAEHRNAWYRDGCAGYAARLADAGLYTEAEARHAACEPYLSAVPLHHYTWHLVDELARLDKEREAVTRLLALCDAAAEAAGAGAS